MTTHTPGPLYVTNTARCDEMIDCDTVLIQVRAGGDGPMDTDTTVGYFYNDADARLMVAAPEMLAMIERLARPLEHVSFTEARALLARIEGDKP